VSDRQDPQSGLADERRTALLEAAIAVFARYGYRKAAMDQVARAAGLSRQGLYLHFPSKEALFRQVIAYLLDRALGDALAALTAAKRPLGERLVDGLDAMYGQYVEGLGATPHIAELIETSSRLVGSLIADQERTFRDAMAKQLQHQRNQAAGLSAVQLADLLEAVAYGLKHRLHSRADFRQQLSHAVALVCGD
jgi:AcrR family transcriptional regulator